LRQWEVGVNCGSGYCPRSMPPPTCRPRSRDCPPTPAPRSPWAGAAHHP